MRLNRRERQRECLHLLILRDYDPSIPVQRVRLLRHLHLFRRVFEVLCLREDIVGHKVLLFLKIVGFLLNDNINFLLILPNLNNLVLNVVGPLDQVINAVVLVVNPIGVNHKIHHNLDSEQVNTLHQCHSVVNLIMDTLEVADRSVDHSRDFLRVCQVH
jgi:hypothetical protein